MAPNFADARLVTVKQTTQRMNEPGRDLLLLTKTDELSSEEMEREVERLNSILYHTETWECFCVANEIIDINRHKIIQQAVRIESILRRDSIKPFVFINNKN